MEEVPQYSTHEACETLTTTVELQASTSVSSRMRRFASGSLIWQPSDLPDQVFRLESGRVHIVSVLPNGEEHLVRVVEPGELLGEMCFCRYRTFPHGTLARSIGRTELKATSYQDFRRALQRDGSLVDSVLRTFCERVAEAGQRQGILACKDARERLARLLLHFAEQRSPQHSSADREQVVIPTMSHADLAASAALSRPHVSVLMAEFRQRGLLTYGRTEPLTLQIARLHEAFDC
jgi:CRP-like cAMP-binding protein